jgi:hypothetical protein
MQAPLRKELRLNQESVWHDIDSNLPDEVVHFTSSAGLEGILRSQTLWCTDIRQVNDPREGDHGMVVIRRVVARMNFSLPKQFKALIRGSLYEGLFGMKSTYTVYIVCFAAKPLSPRMWKEYADGGNGCAIVFDYKTLEEDQKDGDAYSIFRVLYELESQMAKIRWTLSDAAKMCRDANLKPPAWNEFWLHEVPFTLLTCGARFKAESYRHEGEIRLYVAGGDNAQPFKGPDGRERVAVAFRKDAIKRIERLSSSALTSSDIENRLMANGYPDVPILDV